MNDEIKQPCEYQLGIYSGFFNPLHEGHLECMAAAKELCDRLFVVVNNDRQVVIKGSKPFMDERHRLTIVSALRSVDYVLVSLDGDESVAVSLTHIANTFENQKIAFINSGDRSPAEYNAKEQEVCDLHGIDQIFIELKKKHSSRNFR